MADAPLSSERQLKGWVDGLAEWTEGQTAYLSIAFTWKILEARDRARSYAALGYQVKAGGPALFLPSRRKLMEQDAEVGGAIEDVVTRHHPQATIASRGCPAGCWYCTVPKMWGTKFTLLPDFKVRPILCDNNLSALPAEYQVHIIERYQAEGVPLLDANSGFEPRTFDGAVYERWRKINRGPWRFAYDDLQERTEVLAVMRMLNSLPPKRKRVYVLIGNEPFEECMGRIREVIEWGGEPHVQPLMKLNALEKEHWVRFDWTAEKLRAVARWANRRLWRYMPFSLYAGAIKSSNMGRYDAQQGLFV